MTTGSHNVFGAQVTIRPGVGVGSDVTVGDGVRIDIDLPDGAVLP